MKNTLIAILAGLVGALVLDKLNHECPRCDLQHYGVTFTTTGADVVTDLGPDPWRS